MDILATTHASLALVNLIFAVIALAVGFAAGAWVCGNGFTAARDGEGGEDAGEDKANEKQLALDRTLMASDRLRDLAQGVASDVDAHNASIGKIEAGLAEARDSGATIDEAGVYRVMDQISSANTSLQEKLAIAEAQIQSQAEQIRTHESEARTDALTDLANRRAFDDELTRRFSEWHRRGTPFSLLILDVDHFKKFNDTHGHQAGDEVLRKVADSLKECCRDMDLPCRYGGEEFAVVMPSTVGRDGCALAERSRRAIEQMTVPFEGKKLKVTASFGLAQADSDDDPIRLIKRADAALYKSKEAGRNCAHMNDGVECTPITPSAMKPAAESRTTEKSLTVVLDGLPNRTRFLDELRQSVRDAHESAEPLTLLAVELEGHGKLKSEFGPAIARLTLDSIAQFLDNSLREHDVLGRLGEGQFVILMPATPVAESQSLGERIGVALAGCSVPLGSTSLQLDTSMGVSELHPDETAAALMKRVEKALSLGSSQLTTPVMA